MLGGILDRQTRNRTAPATCTCGSSGVLEFVPDMGPTETSQIQDKQESQTPQSHSPCASLAIPLHGLHSGDLGFYASPASGTPTDFQ